MMQRYMEKLSPVLEAAARMEEILDDKVDVAPQPKEEEQPAKLDSRPVYEPKLRRLEFMVEKTPFQMLGEHRPLLTADTKVVESLCKQYFAFLNPGCSEVYRRLWHEG